MIENKFFSAQTYTSTQQLKDPEIFRNALLGLVLPRMPCPMQFFESGRFVGSIDWSSDLFNKPVWTKLNELPDSLSQKNGVYILFLEQSNYHEYHLTSLSNLPKCKVEIVKTSYKGASLLREVLQLQIDSPPQNLKKRTCVICLSTTSLLLSISGISVAISGIPGSHVSGGFSSAC